MVFYLALAAAVFFIGFSAFIVILCMAAGRPSPTPTRSTVEPAPQREVKLRRVRPAHVSPRRYARVYNRY